MPDTLIIIPAHNEAHSICSVLNSLKSQGYKNILVVDDASSDNTKALALSEGVKVISLPYNLGAWKATQAGIRYAVEKGYSSAVTFDADGQHLAATLSKLIRTHKTGNHDIVIGSCTSRGSIARHLAWKIFRKLSGLEVEDLTSGLRVYNHKALEVLSRKEATLLEYQDVGVLLLLKSHKISKAEVPVKMIKRKDGISRIFHSWWAVLYYMAYTGMLCLSKIAKTHHFSTNKKSQL